MSVSRGVTQPRIRLADRDGTAEEAFRLPSPEVLADLVRSELGAEFELYREVGRGKLGTVYFARDLAAGHPVALKVFPRHGALDVDVGERFHQAAERAAALDHPHIVPMLRAGVTPSLLWYAAEYVEGRTLRDTLRQMTPMALRDCLRLAEQVASALYYAHRRGVVHGNLNPSTIFVDGAGWARVREFGVRRAVTPARPVQVWSAALEAPGYLAPESLYHQPVDPSGDQYSLAVLIHECLTGGTPFSGETPEELARQHATDRPTRVRHVRPDVPTHVDEALQRALDRTPTRRFGDVLELMAALDATPRGPRSPRAARPAAVGASPDVAPLFAPPSPPPPSPALPPPAAAPAFGAVPEPGLLFPGPAPEGPPMPTPAELARVVGWPAPPPRRGTRVGVAASVVLLLTVGAALFFKPAPDSGYFAGPERPAADGPSGAVDRARPDRGGEYEPSPPTLEPAPVRRTAPPATSSAETARPPNRPSWRPATPSPATAAPAPTAAGTGRLIVGSTPWGRVYVDGRLIGETPVLDLSVAAGTHSVLIVREGYQIHAQTISVAPGETVRLTGVVLKESAP